MPEPSFSPVLTRHRRAIFRRRNHTTDPFRVFTEERATAQTVGRVGDKAGARHTRYQTYMRRTAVVRTLGITLSKIISADTTVRSTADHQRSLLSSQISMLGPSVVLCGVRGSAQLEPDGCMLGPLQPWGRSCLGPWPVTSFSFLSRARHYFFPTIRGHNHGEA
ncbi:hypothetical protein L209DRAFT_750553 [Thermothelomyces heterothallicus CBS 203.75]